MAERLARGPLPERDALRYARQIAESLSEAHEHGVFHRDLKPENIVIERVGMSTVVKVLDFGIAGDSDTARLTQGGEVFGTPQYMSPEQCNGLAVDARTDVYSLGCILYEMIEGRPPFSGKSAVSIMLKQVRGQVPAPRRMSPETSRAVLCALRKDRSRRFPTAARFAHALGHCIGALRNAGRVETLPHGRARPDASTGPNRPEPSTALEATASRRLAERQGKTLAAVLVIVALGLFSASLFDTVGPMPPAVLGAHTPSLDPPDSGPHPKNRALVHGPVEGATVRVDGLPQCQAPCTIEVPVGDRKSHEIRLVKPGYVDRVRSWEPASVTDTLPAWPAMKLAPRGTARQNGVKNAADSPE
jgi:serine/threonine-protein kinase